METKRQAGILLPVFALPGNYGIGDFGPSAYDFVDKLAISGTKIWQILPLNPVGLGNSPYQPLSSKAGDETYIDIDSLFDEGLVCELPEKVVSMSVDYDKVRLVKSGILKEAYANFKPKNDYIEFKKQKWVQDWSKFISETKKSGNWIDWKNKDNVDELAVDEYEIFIQFYFYKQWNKLKNYANDKGIQIMGDIPFYVGMNSDDVWLNKKCFLLDAECMPTHVAGVPPDYFSKHGQRWGNPLYDWDYLEKTKFEFLITRLKSSVDLYDIIRLDHFRAFDTYFKIPSGCPTAENGDWVLAPGYKFFDQLLQEILNINIVVEDLGELRPEVVKLKDHYNFIGMKIVQFSFNPNEINNGFEDNRNVIIYTGTHDNDTILGWFHGNDKEFQLKVLEELDKYDGDISDKMLRFTLDNVASIAIIPIQDIVKLDGKSRINTPGTIGSPNWQFKLESLDGFDTLKFKSLLVEYDRC